MRPASEKIILITTRPLAYVSVILKYYNYFFLKKYKNKYLTIICLHSAVLIVHIMTWMSCGMGQGRWQRFFLHLILNSCLD